MFDRLAEIEQKYMDLADQVNDPEIIAKPEPVAETDEGIQRYDTHCGGISGIRKSESTLRRNWNFWKINWMMISGNW